MADDAVFAGPKGKGPNWLLIGGLGVGAVALVVVVSKMGGGGGGTTAAGASINAGLGSLQEEQMNLLGTVQAGALANSANFTGVGNNMAKNQAQLVDQYNVLLAGEQNIVDTIMPQLNQITTLQQQLLTSSGSQATAIQTAISNLRDSILAAINSGANANSTAFSSIIGLINGNMGTTTSQLGTILNWTDEIKARLQQGDYSAPFHGPSNQPWTTAA